MRVYEKCCKGKRRFNSYADALRAISEMPKYKHPGGKRYELRPYCCPFCQFVHMGHSLRLKPSQMKRRAKDKQNVAQTTQGI